MKAQEVVVFKIDDGSEILILDYNIDEDEALQLFLKYDRAYKIEALAGYYLREDFKILTNKEV